jgi:hypothetical protein
MADAGRLVNVHHITFATGDFILPAWLLSRSARRYGMTSRIYRPSDPVVRELAQCQPDIMRLRRGAGYWLWKPYILRDALSQAADGDVVFYTDAAAVIVADPAPLVGLVRDRPIVVFELEGMKAREWTKRDAFVVLDADRDEFWNAPMACATFQLYRAGPEARDFVEALCVASADARVLTDAPNAMGSPNLPEFRDHRHDQSVLTILARQQGLPMFPDPSQFGPSEPRMFPAIRPDGVERPPAPYAHVLRHHRKKNNKVLQWYARYRFANRAPRPGK